MYPAQFDYHSPASVQRVRPEKTERVGIASGDELVDLRL